MNRIGLTMLTFLIAACVSQPEPWSPDGKTADSKVNGDTRNADGRGNVDPSDVRSEKDAPTPPQDVVEIVDLTVLDAVDAVGPTDLNDAGMDAVEEVKTPDTVDLVEEDVCVPDCDGKECGDDGCGGQCGSCPGCGDQCDEGSCEFAACNGKDCGDDGCGGLCGVCSDQFQFCSEGSCECTFATCDSLCCPVDEVCSDGKCCLPDCEGKVCGDDGCGGECGECGAQVCQWGLCIDEIASTYILIPAGSFVMGTPDGSGEEPQENCHDGSKGESPQHEILLDHPFYLKQTEVTQKEWLAVMGEEATEFHFTACGDYCPAETLTWYEAIAYCNSLSELEGFEKCYGISGDTVTWPKGYDCLGYRLPTEAEWEYAARAGTDTPLYNGEIQECLCGEESGLDDIAWYCGNSEVTYEGCSTTGIGSEGPQCSGPHPVGLKEPNPWQLYDMAGNIQEWVWDRWALDYYEQSPATNPMGPDGEDSDYRGLRGGAWYTTAGACRSGKRYNYYPYKQYRWVGLRVARTACIPDCDGKECSDDGCGGECGICEYGFSCVEHECKEYCEPQCTTPGGSAKQCGPDGCGGSCGECGEGQVCIQDTGTCGASPCGNVTETGECVTNKLLQKCVNNELVETSCTTLGESYYCNWNGPSQQYVCSEGCSPKCQFPDGTPKKCGDDGCGGICGNCPAGWPCESGTCNPQEGADCGWITQSGACIDNQLWFCNVGQLYVDDCPGKDLNCGFDTGTGKFKCK